MIEPIDKRKAVVSWQRLTRRERKGPAGWQAPSKQSHSWLEVNGGDYCSPAAGRGNGLVVDPELTADTRVGGGLRVVAPTLLAEVAVIVTGQASWARIRGGTHADARNHAIRRQFSGEANRRICAVAAGVH